MNTLLSLNKKLVLILCFIIFIVFIIFFILKYYNEFETVISYDKNIVSNADITEPKFAIKNSSQKIFVTAKEGNFIDETINVEIIPYQNRDNYFIVKDLLLENYNVIEDKISRYDKMFDNYEIFDFCWHTKIKLYTNREPVVKFYRTYPHNPFIGYHNYK